MPKQKTSTWKIILIILIVLIAIVLFRNLIWLSNANQNIPPIVPVVEKNINYGSYDKQKFDFYSNGEDSDVLLILVHGGAWVTGDKNQFDETSDFFANKGYSVVNMNYRLAPNWKYDTQLYDIAELINYVSRNYKRFNLQPGYKIVLLGHSAGAHLSSLFGLRENYYGMQNVFAIVSVAGPYDLELPLHAPILKAARDSFRGDATLAEISPVNYIYAGEKTKFLLISAGESDGVVAKEHYEVFLEELEEKNVFVGGYVIFGRDHSSIVNMIPQNDIVAQEILGFLG